MINIVLNIKYVLVLPPVLVPRFSEYPNTMPTFQQVSDGSMPCNVNFPHGFPQLSPDNSAPGSPFSLPGKKNNCFVINYNAIKQ